MKKLLRKISKNFPGVEISKADFPGAHNMMPYYAVGKTLMPDDYVSPGIVIPLDGDYVVQIPPPRKTYRWLVDKFQSQDEKFLDFSKHMSKYSDFSDVTEHKVDDLSPYFYNNYFSFGDALALTTLLAEHNPKRYVEIGCGNSTKYTRRAIKKYDLQTSITCIDPSPRAQISEICDEWIPKGLLDVDVELFTALEAGDFLMLDGSHLVFQGTDTTHFMMEILPLLKEGVIIHMHDIHLPNDYPEVCDRLFWNEQYILAAFLMNHPIEKIIAPIAYMHHHRNLCQEGASFWLEV